MYALSDSNLLLSHHPISTKFSFCEIENEEAYRIPKASFKVLTSAYLDFPYPSFLVFHANP